MVLLCDVPVHELSAGDKQLLQPSRNWPMHQAQCYAHLRCGLRLVAGARYLLQLALWTPVGRSPFSDVLSVLCCDFRPPGKMTPPYRDPYGAQDDEKITVGFDPVPMPAG